MSRCALRIGCERFVSIGVPVAKGPIVQHLSPSLAPPHLHPLNVRSHPFFTPTHFTFVSRIFTSSDFHSALFFFGIGKFNSFITSCKSFHTAARVSYVY